MSCAHGRSPGGTMRGSRGRRFKFKVQCRDNFAEVSHLSPARQNFRTIMCPPLWWLFFEQWDFSIGLESEHTYKRFRTLQNIRVLSSQSAQQISSYSWISYERDMSEGPALSQYGANLYSKTSFGKLKASCKQVCLVRIYYTFTARVQILLSCFWLRILDFSP